MSVSISVHTCVPSDILSMCSEHNSEKWWERRKTQPAPKKLNNINIPTLVSTIARLLLGNLLSVLLILDPIFIMRNRDVREVISEIKLVKYFRRPPSN